MLPENLFTLWRKRAGESLRNPETHAGGRVVAFKENRNSPEPEPSGELRGDPPVFQSARTDKAPLPEKTDKDSLPENAACSERPTVKTLAAKGKSSKLILKAVDEIRDSSYINPMSGTLNIYTRHFGLNARPFTLVPDPDFLFWSPAHVRAFTMLEYGTLTGSPITLITGEVGAGKTTLLHKFLKRIGEDVTVGLVSNAHGSRGELLRWALMALDQPADRDATYVDLFDTFQKYLISEYARGHRVVLIFDEAQNLSIESLEELRMFTNINSNKDELLQLVLVGQPELRDIIHRPELRQFAQRIAASFHLSAMDERTVTAYIGHRLRVAGARKNLFAEAACRLIYEQTGGVPRLVNQLCDLSMVYAFSKNQKTVTLATVEDVLADGAFFAAGAFPQEPVT